jgi:hypothetical protein
MSGGSVRYFSDLIPEGDAVDGIENHPKAVDARLSGDVG